MFNNKWILLFISWLWILPTSIQWISHKISLLGIYHDVHPEKETVQEKMIKVYSANVYLTFIFVIAYYIVISNTLKTDQLKSYDIFCFSFLLTLVSIITVRILTNPPEFLATKISDLYPEKDRYYLQEKHNERIIAFFHSFLCGALIVLGIVVSANIIQNEYISLYFTPNIKVISIVYLLCTYGLALPIFTILLELILLRYPPIIKVRK